MLLLATSLSTHISNKSDLKLKYINKYFSPNNLIMYWSSLHYIKQVPFRHIASNLKAIQTKQKRTRKQITYPLLWLSQLSWRRPTSDQQERYHHYYYRIYYKFYHKELRNTPHLSLDTMLQYPLDHTSEVLISNTVCKWLLVTNSFISSYHT